MTDNIETTLHRVSAILIVAILVALVHGLAGAQPELSPAEWPAAERERYEQLQQRGGGAWFADSETAMIVSSSNPLATHAGLETIRQGGSAADAAIATALAQIALMGGSWNSYAGIFNMVYYDAETKKVYALNAGFNTVLAEDDPLTIPALGQAGRCDVAGKQPSGRRLRPLPVSRPRKERYKKRERKL